MISLISSAKAQQKLAENIRGRRLGLELTQKSLSERSGVALSTLRKFEQKGEISLESFLKLLMVLGGLEELVNVLRPSKLSFSSIDEVLEDKNRVNRKRGRKR